MVGGRPFWAPEVEAVDLGMARAAAGDSAATKRWFDLMMTDVQTPAATRMRVEKLMALGASPGNT